MRWAVVVMVIPMGAWPRCPAHLQLWGQRDIVPKPPPCLALGERSHPRARCSSTGDPAATAVFNRIFFSFYFFLEGFVVVGFF